MRAIYCFLNQSCEPFLELSAHPTFYRYIVCKSQLKKNKRVTFKSSNLSSAILLEDLGQLIGHLHDRHSSLPRILLIIIILLNHSESLLRRIAQDVRIRSLLFPTSFFLLNCCVLMLMLFFNNNNNNNNNSNSNNNKISLKLFHKQPIIRYLFHN